MTIPTAEDLRSRLAVFSRYRSEYLTGDEKGEAQVFCDRLFQAFGHGGVREAGATLEMRLRRNDVRGTAFADLMWKPRCLVEMKKAGTDLSRHYRQAFDYWVLAVPDRPRFVVLCNFDEFWVYDFNNQLDEPVDRIRLVDLPQRSEALAFLLPQAQEPVFGNDLVAVTRDAAHDVGLLFRTMHDRGIDRGDAQRFVLQSVMAMFAEDIGLLPTKMFTRALEDSNHPDQAFDLLFGLFREMDRPGVTGGGRYVGTPYFNGGLFAEVTPVQMTATELDLLRAAAETNWAEVRPEIFGTLFEGSMDDSERHALGAHFTSQADIAKVVVPTIVMPWRARFAAAGSINELEIAINELATFRVLDPACGSGNFLYVAYREMRRLEHEAKLLITERRRSTAKAAQGAFSYVTPDHFFGIDINPFAVEVAKVTMMLGKKLAADELDEEQTVLPLDNLDSSIVAGDALFMDWPAAHAVIGNPPYLGRRLMADELGTDYTQRLAAAYPNVSGVSDFVCYWFPRAHDHLPAGGRAGFVATKTIREADSRKASLDYLVDNGGRITDAVSAQPWSGDAAVTVSIVNWIKQPSPEEAAQPAVLWLNAGNLRIELPSIPSSLSPRVDVRSAADLPSNRNPATCFQGQTPGITRGYVLNASERDLILATDPGSADVILPFLGGDDMLKKLAIDRWIVDVPFPDLLDARTTVPGAMSHLESIVLPERQRLRDKETAANADEQAKAEARGATFRPQTQHKLFMSRWWHLWRRRPELLVGMTQLDRYIATSRHASEKRATVFEFVDTSIRPGDSMSVILLDDDYSFGVISSSCHRQWLEARCSTLETRLRYTPTTVWDSFPWPQAPTAAQVNAIVQVTDRLLQLRAKYLARGVPLATQYNSLRQPGRSALRDLHAELDAAVIAAYGFSADDDLLAQLLALNLDVSVDPAGARGPGCSGLPNPRVSTYRFGAPASVDA